MSVQAPRALLPIQLFLDMFTPHEIEVWTYAETVRQQRKEKRQLRVTAAWIQTNSGKTKAIDEISLDLLDQPLGPNQDPEFHGLGNPYIEVDDGYVAPQSNAEQDTWSDDAIDQLHEGVLLYSLKVLNARGNGEEKKDVLRWIFDPAAMAVVIDADADEKVWRFIQASEVPFSFELCCRLAGYDAERMREGLVPSLKNLGLDALFKEIEYAQQCEQGERAARCRDHSQANEIQHSLDLRHARGAGKSRNHGGDAGVAGSAKEGPVLCVRNGQNARPDNVLGRRVQSTVD